MSHVADADDQIVVEITVVVTVLCLPAIALLNLCGGPMWLENHSVAYPSLIVASWLSWPSVIRVESYKIHKFPFSFRRYFIPYLSVTIYTALS